VSLEGKVIKKKRRKGKEKGKNKNKDLEYFLFIILRSHPIPSHIPSKQTNRLLSSFFLAKHISILL